MPSFPRHPERSFAARSAAAKRAVAACFLAALGACGGGEAVVLGSERGFVRDLLDAKPFALLEEKGVLAPDPKGQWGEYSLGGWHDETGEQDGVAGVFTRAPRARLRLPVRRLEDRVVELTLWSPAEALGEGADETIQILLNDVSLAVLEPSVAVATHALACPMPMWVEGDNVLELVVSGDRRGTDWRGVALAKVRYGTERVPNFDSGVAGAVALKLPDGTGARWAIERAGAASVEVRARTEGAGRLEVLFASLDPCTGSIEELPDAQRSSVYASDEAIEDSVPVPDVGGKIALASVQWNGEDGATVVVEALRVVEQRAPPPPIVFISIDTLSARHMSIYGYGRETTPELARLAADSVTFEHCVTNAPWTLPSYLSVMSGLFTFSNLRERERDRTRRKREAYDIFGLADGRWSLAEMLHASGYRTAAFVDNLWLTESSGLQQGFELYDTSAGRIPKENVSGGVQHVVARALDWLDAREVADPYFLFLHAFDVHGPYLPPEPFAGTFHDDALYDPKLRAPSGSVVYAYGAIPNYILPCGATMLGKTCEHGTHALDDVEALYDEGILAMDAAVGGFLDELRARGLYDDALIVFSADHGETAHESNYYFGHGVLEDSVLHVPLVVKLPGGRGAGRRVSSLVQLVDLYPTLRELVGLSGERDFLHGRSLVPLLEGRELEPAPAISSSGIMRQYCVQYDGWKFVESYPEFDSNLATKLTNPLVPRAWLEEHAPEVLAGSLVPEVYERLLTRFGPEQKAELTSFIAGPHLELYRLEDDPECRTNLIASEPEQARVMQEFAAQAAQRSIEAQRNVSWTGPQTSFSEENIAELKSLGYLGDDLGDD